MADIINNLPRVLFISHEGNSMKGSTFSLLNLINSLKNKIKPVVIIPSGGEACDEFEKRGITHYVIPFKFDFTDKKGIERITTFIPRYLRDWITNQLAIKKIVKIAHCHNINIVHSNSAVIDFGQRVAQKLQIKHVWHLREFLNLDFNYTPLAGWSSFLKKINQSDTIICISKSVYKHYRLSNNKKALVLYNAIKRMEDIQIIKEKKNYLLFCGVVTPEKGIENALVGFSIIYRNYALKLLVVGSIKKTYHSHLLALIDKLEITNAVEFLGFQQNIDELMSSALCLLMCSKHEALGRVTIEAMFNGCPVIGYASDGTLEIISDNETGFLYSTVPELAKKVSFLIENPEAALPIIKNAQIFAQSNFSEEQYAKRLMNIYKKLM
jgi:glycosyltransferase involved in cell wall biosynthesis